AALGRRVGKSPRQLARLFNDHVGTTPHRRYLAMRLDRAQRLLAESWLSVTQVAVATGFNHLAHFSRAYKARFGESPRTTIRRRTPAAAGPGGIDRVFRSSLRGAPKGDAGCIGVLLRMRFVLLHRGQPVAHESGNAPAAFFQAGVVARVGNAHVAGRTGPER